MQPSSGSTSILILLLSLPLTAFAMGPGMPPQVAKAIGHCAEARQADTQEDPQQSQAYCGEAMESLQGVSDVQVMLDAMAATVPDGDGWPWHDAAVLAEHGGDLQDRERFREAWQQARADADEMLEAYLRRTASDAGAGTAGKRCDTRGCFAQAVHNCRDAHYTTARQAGARARYAVAGAADDGGCRVSMTYTANPNPDWVGKPLTFVLEPGAQVEAQLKAAVSGCLTAAAGDFQCGGPLYEAVAGSAGQGR